MQSGVSQSYYYKNAYEDGEELKLQSKFEEKVCLKMKPIGLMHIL